MDTEYQFKRILLKNELNELKQLIDNAIEFTSHYPNFNKWTENAVKEILKGDRLAYGILISKIIDGRPKLILIGITIVKITEPFAEMKSLFLKEEFRHKEKKYGDILYTKTEKQLMKRGLTKIITDVPFTNQTTSSFLIKNGFQINGLIERYKKGDLNYILSKDLVPDYIGDPFDWFNLVKWVLKNVYNFEISECEKVDNETQSFSFNLNNNNNTFSISAYKPVKGVCLVYDGTINNNNFDHLFEIVHAKDVTVCSMVAKRFEDDTGYKCTKNRILFLDENQIYSLSSLDKPTFGKNDIAGMIIEIRNTFFEKIKNDGDPFVYFKGPGIGKYSNQGNDLLFFVDSCDQYPNGAIMGIGKVKMCSYDTPKKQWERYCGMNPIFSKEDFDRYAKYKHKVNAFVVEDFKRIPPIEYHDLITILKNQLHIDIVEHHYLNHSLIEGIFALIKNENLKEESEGKLARKVNVRKTNF